jgi:hypothetical protein
LPTGDTRPWVANQSFAFCDLPFDFGWGLPRSVIQLSLRVDF